MSVVLSLAVKRCIALVAAAGLGSGGTIVAQRAHHRVAAHHKAAPKPVKAARALPDRPCLPPAAFIGPSFSTMALGPLTPILPVIDEATEWRGPDYTWSRAPLHPGSVGTPIYSEPEGGGGGGQPPDLPPSSPTPEPAIWLSLMIGFGFAGAAMRRGRFSATPGSNIR